MASRWERICEHAKGSGVDDVEAERRVTDTLNALQRHGRFRKPEDDVRYQQPYKGTTFDAGRHILTPIGPVKIRRQHVPNVTVIEDCIAELYERGIVLPSQSLIQQELSQMVTNHFAPTKVAA